MRLFNSFAFGCSVVPLREAREADFHAHFLTRWAANGHPYPEISDECISSISRGEILLAVSHGNMAVSCLPAGMAGRAKRQKSEKPGCPPAFIKGLPTADYMR
jgi:hypothetical protein